jgi:excisionase family DNA binding protein
MIESYLTVEEVAAALRIHETTVTRWLKEKKLPARKVGRRWLIAKEDYDKIVSQGVIE